MKKFSELTEKERYALGQCMGEHLLGTCSYPSEKMDIILESREIEDDGDAEMDADFCMGLDEVTICCDDCGWYVPSDEINEFGICGDCGGYEEE